MFVYLLIREVFLKGISVYIIRNNWQIYSRENEKLLREIVILEKYYLNVQYYFKNN